MQNTPFEAGYGLHPSLVAALGGVVLTFTVCHMLFHPLHGHVLDSVSVLSGSYETVPLQLGVHRNDNRGPARQ